MSDNLDAATTWARGLIARWPGEPVARYLTALVNAAEGMRPDTGQAREAAAESCAACGKPVRRWRQGDAVVLKGHTEWVHADGRYMCNQLTGAGFTFAWPSGVTVQAPASGGVSS